jgi:hypothetical protein
MLPHQSTIHGTKSQIHVQFHVETISRAGSKDYYPLAVAFVDIEHGKDGTTSHVVYSKHMVSMFNVCNVPSKR